MTAKGIALRELGKNEEALAYFDKALEVNPINAFVWYNKAISVAESREEQRGRRSNTHHQCAGWTGLQPGIVRFSQIINFFGFLIAHVLSRNHLTSHVNIDVSKLSNRDIQRIIQQWVNEKPVVEIARYFQITRQRVYQLINQFRESGEYPVLRQSGRKPQTIDDRAEELILKTYQSNNIGPIHLEKKIEETLGIHIPHNRIYRVLLNHGLVEINMKKRQQRKYIRYERTHSMSMWQGDWKEFELNGSKKWLIAFMDDSSRLITCIRGIRFSNYREHSHGSESGIPDVRYTPRDPH